MSSHTTREQIRFFMIKWDHFLVFSQHAEEKEKASQVIITKKSINTFLQQQMVSIGKKACYWNIGNSKAQTTMLTSDRVRRDTLVLESNLCGL